MTKKFPNEERYGLSSQIRRAAVSIPSNIAEGWGRMSRKELRRYILIARGSAMEVETQIILAVKLEFMTREDAIPIWKQQESVNKLLSGMLRSLNKD